MSYGSHIRQKTKFRIKEYYGNDISSIHYGKTGVMIEAEFPKWSIQLDDGHIVSFTEDECMRVGRHIEEVVEGA